MTRPRTPDALDEPPPDDDYEGIRLDPATCGIPIRVLLEMALPCDWDGEPELYCTCPAPSRFDPVPCGTFTPGCEACGVLPPNIVCPAEALATRSGALT